MNQPPYVLAPPIQAAASPEIRNHTQFPGQYFQMADSDDTMFHVLVSRLTYNLAALNQTGYPQLAEVQQELVQEDRFYGEVNTSSLIEESDFAPYKPRCDVLFTHANAYPPAGKAATRWPIGVRIGQWEKLLTVCGPRHLSAGALGYTLSAPQPTTHVPLRYEQAYGGTCQWPLTLAEGEAPEIYSQIAANPIGCGLLDKRWLKQTRPQTLPAPQIEVHNQPLDERALHKHDYPVVGLGAIARWWQPRIALGGTFDEDWQAHHWPRMPQDFDPAYWNCAPPDQQIDYPQGGEDVVLVGLTPDGGRFQTKLPDRPPHALVRLYAGPVFERPMHLDTLVFDLRRMQLACVHRMLIAADAEVRVLEIRRKE